MPRNDPEYIARHKRVHKERGKASAHRCVDCGSDAEEWSQTKGTDGERPSDYRPRCRKCHAKYDNVSERMRGPRSEETKQRMRDAWKARKQKIESGEYFPTGGRQGRPREKGVR